GDVGVVAHDAALPGSRQSVFVIEGGIFDSNRDVSGRELVPSQGGDGPLDAVILLGDNIGSKWFLHDRLSLRNTLFLRTMAVHAGAPAECARGRCGLAVRWVVALCSGGVKPGVQERSSFNFGDQLVSLGDSSSRP